MSVERQVNKAIEIAKSKRGTILAEAISSNAKKRPIFFLLIKILLPISI